RRSRRPVGTVGAMAFTLPDLPYAPDALAPHLSAETFQYHHGKHHNAYVTKANELTNGEHTDADLDKLILETGPGGLFNQLAQHVDPSFWWDCMSSNGGGEPTGEVADAINGAFGSVSDFVDKLKAEAAGPFGSGWAWLVHDGSGLQVVSTHDAYLPLKHGQKALLTIDVWEHAYYVDYRNARPDYLSAFLDHLVNWEFVGENLKAV